jgi:putative tryptophan/tyrosine transport system substrate-binding protein
VKRRQFITLLCGATAAWPIAAQAQQRERMRRIGLLINLAADDPESQARRSAFQRRLAHLGWIDGRNVRIVARWGAGDAAHIRRYAEELVASAPDVILATTSPAVAALQQTTRTVPIVFASVVDPVGGGLVDSIARPGGNTTGFTLFEYGLSGKWPGLLRQFAPSVMRAAVLRDATLMTGVGQLHEIQAVASSLELPLSPVGVHDTSEIERGITSFAHESNGGLIVTGSPSTAVHRDLIITLAARHRLPAIYPFRYFTTSGGLISYGPDSIEPYQRAAGYVDRILKGEKPTDLPVQAPSKYELVVNLRTAKALGLGISPAILARADEVIE